MALLRVQLFGHFSATFDGVPLTTLNTPRLQILFAYLILNRTASIFRYHLAYQFWPDSNEAQARTNLRNLIHLLRQALPNFDHFIRSDAQTLQWREDAPYTLDVLEFEQLLAVTPGKSPDRECLDRAVTLYQGDLLPSCYDDWIIPERERLHRAFLANLEALAEIAESSRDYPAALEYTHRLLQVEPLHGVANRQLIRLCSLVEDRPAALKAYQAYAKVLEHELDIQPDQETQDLYAYLKSRAGQKNHLPGRSTQPVLVGRQTEWHRLLAAWRSAASGSPQAVFVTGEAGIGKTRLVEELVQWASRQGIHTAVANCYPAEGSLPYAPVASWLRSQPLPILEDVWLSEISRLLPEVLTSHPRLTPPKPLTESWQRLRLFEALARAVLGNRRKLLLVIEDIHWCDQDTLEWLHFLLRFDAQAPILCVATERIEEVTAPDHPLHTLQAMLAGVDKFMEIKLKPLNEAESIQLASQVAEQGSLQPLNPEKGMHIFSETEGNPLFVVEMVRLGYPLQSTGDLSGESVPVSVKVQAILKQRINQLSAPTHELVSLAATIGREFRLDVFKQASGLDEDALVKALNELLQRRIVYEQTSNHYDFTHDKLRQAVLAGLSSAHRRLLHRKVAEAYLRLDVAAPHRQDAEIASHYERSGLHLQAVQHYQLAADSAAHIFANNDAQRYLHRAIELAETLGIGEPNSISFSDFAGLLERMGDLLALNGEYPQAQASFERALAQPYPPSRMWRSHVFRKISDALIQQYQHPLAFAALDQAEQALCLSTGGGTSQERQEWIQIQLARSQQSYWCNLPDQIDAIVQQIRPMVEVVGRMDQKVELLRLQALARLRHERYRVSEETVEIQRRRLDMAETLADPYSLAMAQFELGFCLLWHGEPRSGQEWVRRGYEAAVRMGARLLQVRCLAYLGVISRKLVNIDTLRQQTEQLLELAPRIEEHAYHGIGLANRGWLAWREGDDQGAERFCKAALEIWNKFGNGNVFQCLSIWVLLAIAVYRRDLEEADRYARALLDPNPLFQPIEEPMACLLVKALSACQAGDQADAMIQFQRALNKAQEFGDL